MRGGLISTGINDITANIISGTVDIKSDGTFVFSAYLGSGTMQEKRFPSACISITGTAATHTWSSTDIEVVISNGFSYFSLDATEYEKRSVAWDLYEYGNTILNKLSKPSYTFQVDTANFFSLKEFEAF